jgi:hypothetical protein
MKATNDLRFVASVPSNHPENENVPADSADGANWESAWIDLGGEG